MTWTHDIDKSMGISNAPFFRAEKGHMGLWVSDCGYHMQLDGRPSVWGRRKNSESEPKRDRLASEPEFGFKDAV